MDFIEFLKVVLLGVIEGVTEWLPVSSTGHLILFDAFWPLKESEAFVNMFNVVVQLGAILAVVVVFWERLWPFGITKNADQKGVLPENRLGSGGVYARKDILSMWLMVVVSCIPTAVIGLVLELTGVIDYLETNCVVIAAMLILYGVAFIVVETRNKNRTPRVNSVVEIDWKYALLFGLFQSLAMVPGTSRSGATIVGALLIGVSRTTAAEYSFFLAIPTMFGASLLKFVNFFIKGNALGGSEAFALVLGMGVAFLVSMLAIRFLMDFVKKHDFKPFGWYRIALGVLVLIFIFTGLMPAVTA